MKFKSKVDFNRYISLVLVVLLFIWSLYDVIRSFSIFNLLFLGLWSFAIVNVVTSMFKTFYILDERDLIIKSGKKGLRLPYNLIKIITDTSNVETYSYFALSKDTLGIVVNGTVVLISPKEKDKFISELTRKIEANL